jgi:hypothetical protein
MSGLKKGMLPLLHALANDMLEDAAAEDLKPGRAMKFNLKDHYGLISLAPYANSFSGTSFVQWVVSNRISVNGVEPLMKLA